jgi:hypothetical protein
MKNRYMFTDGIKSIDLPQFPDEAWHFYSEEPEKTKDYYASVAAVFRAVNLTADATANMPFALVKGNHDFDHSDKWQNKVGFLPNPWELIRLWRMSLTMTNTAYGFMENKPALLRYIVPTTINPIVDQRLGLTGFKRTLGTSSKDYPVVNGNCPVKYLWRLDHTTELLPSKSTEFKAMCASAGILYYSDFFVESFFKRGGIKPTMLVLKGMANKDTVDKIEGIWDKVIRGYYKYLGKIFQGVDAAGGLEAQTIGEGVDSMKDDTLTNQKIEAVAMAMGIPLSLLLANSANYATAQVEFKAWYDNSIGPWCRFIASALNDQVFTRMGLRFEFRPEMTDPGQEDEVSRAGAYATYCGAGMLPSVAAQIVGIELPENMDYAALDEMAAEKLKAAQDAMSNQSSTDTESSTDNNEEPVPPPPAKFIPNIDQLHELELWRKFAFRKLKKGEPLDFPFDVKTLPYEIAEPIKVGLILAKSEDDIKATFDLENALLFDEPEPIANKSDAAILKLANAINKLVENNEIKGE